jgi:N-acetylmuramoyl-L-alanine amidase
MLRPILVLFALIAWLLPAGTAGAAATVVDARMGLHPDRTRFVLEVAGELNFRSWVEAGPYRLVVELPDLAWAGPGASVRPMGLIRTYRLERPDAGSSRLVFDLAGPARIREAMVLSPREGHQTRLVLDLEAVPAERFAAEAGRVRGTRPPAGAAAAPASTQPPAAAPAVAAPPPPPPPLPVALPAAAPPGASTRGPAGPAGLAPLPPAGAPPTALIPSQTPAARPGAEPPPPTEAAPNSGAGNIHSTAAPMPLHSASVPAPPPPRAAAAVRPEPAAFVPPPAPARPARPAIPARRIVVLDPGHGGQDPGAIGVGGVYEKDLTLALARELRQLLEATGRYKVILTRDSDEFIRLRDRVAVARHAGAELFISLHADSIANPVIRGLSIYTLSDKASDREAEMLAAKENRADAVGGIDLSRENDEVASILIDLAQRDTRNHSHRFARLVLQAAAHDVRLLPQPDRSAGLAVLTAADVPSVLVEMGYLSNAEDVAMLSQPKLRQKLIQSVVRAVDGFFGRAAGRRT